MDYHFSSEYFDASKSIANRGISSINEVLATISARYIGQNPPVPFQFRAFHANAFRCFSDGRFHLNLSDKLSGAKLGSIAYIAACFWKEEAGQQIMRISCYGPVVMYVNGSLLFRSSVREEVNSHVERTFDMFFSAGWNTVIIRCKKVASGFGCLFGPYEASQRWISFLSPFSGRAGRAGFLFSEAVDENETTSLTCIDPFTPEEKTGFKWFPEHRWSPKEETLTPFERIYPHPVPGSLYAAWSSFALLRPNEYTISLHEQYLESIRCVWIDEQHISTKNRTVSLKAGEHNLLVIVQYTGGSQWGGVIDIVDSMNNPVGLKLPVPVHGAPSPWLYAGPFSELPSNPLAICSMTTVFNDKEAFYWRLDGPSLSVRPYLENRFFSRWNYPLGVTLYGLLQTSRMLNRGDISCYVHRHIRNCIDMYEYSLWDEKEYGFPEINAQLVHMKTLDDCGSFGSVMLEEAEGILDDLAQAVAGRIAHHMRFDQERRPEGLFYREQKGYFMENTLWVDDLYMCTPFLIRYAQLSGDTFYLDDAATQFIGFRKLLFLPESNVMSHVFDFKCNTATRMPWGRGNGWCLFSLSELLTVLPTNHKNREELIDFYNSLCAGLIPLQAESGLWRQLLTHTDSYEESSCTAMFVYAFCRGLRMNWIDKALTASVSKAAKLGWDGLCHKSIDDQGNIFGICGGSCYSFSPDYYKHDLGWIVNDPHGTGIVLLAGTEMDKWMKLTSNK